MRIEIKLPEDVVNIMDTLNGSGYEAFIVGGCVRDAVLGRSPDDWDIATSADPAVVKSMFERTADTGLKHGTVTVLAGSGSYEITTFRIDGRYIDGRHPESVEYTRSLEEDLSRRDFTVNAMAYHPAAGLIDPFNGMTDIRNRLIRTVGNPDDRFHEDALRMLRAVRFSAQLDFEVDSGTLRSIAENCRLICKVSSERIREEMTKILMSDNPLKFILLRDTGLLQFTMPELEVCFHIPQNNPYHIYNVGVHSLYAAAAAEKDFCLRWAMLLHDIGKSLSRFTDADGTDHFYGHPEKSAELAFNVLNRLRFDKRSADRILRLIRYHDREILPYEKAVGKAVSSMGADIFEDLLRVKEADKTAQNPEYLEKARAYIGELKRVYLGIRERNACLDLKSLSINGDDLLGLGFPKGREVGDALERLLDMVIEQPELNERGKLLGIAAGMAEELGGE